MPCKMNNCFNLPDIGFGLGLRPQHFEEILQTRPNVDWFEIISENFMGAHQGYKDFLLDLREDYQFAMHGVSLSIGSTDPINKEYLTKLKNLADFLNPVWISDHLCFTGVMGKNTHDLLPIPYTEESLRYIADRIRIVQEFMERPLILENPSSYIEFSSSTLSEPEFIAALAEEADCGLLLDINNVYVSSFNHGMDAKAYIDLMPANRIIQVHLAGHKDCGDYKIDTHDREVPDEVWKLYKYMISKKGQKSTMVEWDEQIPEFSKLLNEVNKAKEYAASCAVDEA
jgi:uncharacterized protein